VVSGPGAMLPGQPASGPSGKDGSQKKQVKVTTGIEEIEVPELSDLSKSSFSCEEIWAQPGDEEAEEACIVIQKYWRRFVMRQLWALIRFVCGDPEWREMRALLCSGDASTADMMGLAEHCFKSFRSMQCSSRRAELRQRMKEQERHQEQAWKDIMSSIAWIDELDDEKLLEAEHAARRLRGSGRSSQRRRCFSCFARPSRRSPEPSRPQRRGCALCPQRHGCARWTSWAQPAVERPLLLAKWPARPHGNWRRFIARPNTCCTCRPKSAGNG